jgi:hypothetical protein
VNTLLQYWHQARSQGLVEKTWFNAIWFQSTWLLCVLGRDAFAPLVIILIGLHFALVASPRQEAAELAPVVALGVVVDSLLSAFGVFDFGAQLVPIWLCLLWVAFATTLTRAFAFLGKRYWLAALVGGVAVPFNYGAGAGFGAVSLPLDATTTALVLMAVWAVLLPVLFRLSRAQSDRRCG